MAKIHPIYRSKHSLYRHHHPPLPHCHITSIINDAPTSLSSISIAQMMHLTCHLGSKGMFFLQKNLFCSFFFNLAPIGCSWLSPQPPTHIQGPNDASFGRKKYVFFVFHVFLMIFDFFFLTRPSMCCAHLPLLLPHHQHSKRCPTTWTAQPMCQTHHLA